MSSQLSIENILDRLNIRALNPMQEEALKMAKEHANLQLLAPTGSGKTLAFLLPLLPLLDGAVRETRMMVIAPSRELALQIESVFRSMGTGLKVLCCYGGHKREIEEQSLVEAPALIIGTPGRLADHIRRGNIQTGSIRALVLDEFDKSLELGFEEEMAFVIGSLKNLERRILTSATEAVAIPDYVNWTDGYRLHFLPEEGTEARLELEMVKTGEKDKVETLFHLLCALGGRSTIVFCNHRESVERTSQLLTERGYPNTFYHGAMEQRDREIALARFRNGSSYLLVTTDLASRGLDIPFLRYIIHFHLPATEEIFRHRNGRTARMEATGTAILLIGPDEKLPDYIKEPVTLREVPTDAPLPEKPKWTTLYIAAGKKDKINKIDIVGFLAQKGELRKEDIGLIEVRDFFSFAAVRRSSASNTLHLVANEKLKGKKIKIEMAR